jgi:N-acetylglucosamine kinase-like BadF-type ATPase
MDFFLALDAGGTKTDYVLADESRELARARSGTIKLMRTDASTAQMNLTGALQELTRTSGVSLQSITRTCIGTAGETVPLVTDWLRQAFHSTVGGDLILLGDVEIALDAAFRGGPGVLVLAGTGSNVAGRASDGHLLHAGGWGPALADQGSGHRIGHQALRAAFLAIDEERPTSLIESILNYWKLNSIPELVEFANRTPSPDVSRLTEIVLDCAMKGDAVAKQVLDTEGKELAHLAELVIHRIQRNDSSLLPNVAFAGSIMEKVLPVRESLSSTLCTEFPGIQLHPGIVDPLHGALWRARSQTA